MNMEQFNQAHTIVKAIRSYNDKLIKFNQCSMNRFTWGWDSKDEDAIIKSEFTEDELRPINVAMMKLLNDKIRSLEEQLKSI